MARRLADLLPTAGLVAGLVAALAAPAPAQTWPFPDYPFRRKVTVAQPKSPATDLKNADVGWVSLPTFETPLDGVLGSASGSAVKVVTLGGLERPSRVLSTGPGSRLAVAWALGPDPTYFIYYGAPPKPAAGQPDPADPAAAFGPPFDWTPRRGVLLESWAYRGGALETLAQVQKTFAKAAEGPPQGAGFVPNLFTGVNPFGPPGAYCHRYTAWLKPPIEGLYTFALSSGDAAFVFLDDQPLIAWPGRHPWVGDQSHTVKVSLKAEPAKLSVLHVNAGSPGGLALCWQGPDDARVVPIPPDAFRTVHRGELDVLGAKAGPTPDFDWAWRGEAFFDNLYSQRYQFTARLPEQWVKVPVTWTIAAHGTSLSLEGRQVEAVFLTAGDYSVTLAAATQPPHSLRATVRVERPWDRVADSDLDQLAQHARLLRATLAQRGVSDLALAVRLFDKLDDPPNVIEAGRLLFGGSKDPLPESAVEVADTFARTCVRHQAARTAVDSLLAGEPRAASPAVAAALATLAGQVALDDLDDVPLATACFRRAAEVHARKTGGPWIRAARLGLGDCFARQGDDQQARAVYATVGDQGDPAQKPLLISSYAHSFEDYTRRKEWAAADDTYRVWTYRYPLERLTGQASYLRAKWWAAQGRVDRAIRVVDTLMGVNEQSVYTPLALLLKADLLVQQNRRPEAIKVWQLIADRFPEHEAALTARSKLGPAASGPGS